MCLESFNLKTPWQNLEHNWGIQSFTFNDHIREQNQTLNSGGQKLHFQWSHNQTLKPPLSYSHLRLGDLIFLKIHLPTQSDT